MKNKNSPFDRVLAQEMIDYIDTPRADSLQTNNISQWLGLVWALGSGPGFAILTFTTPTTYHQISKYVGLETLYLILYLIYT